MHIEAYQVIVSAADTICDYPDGVSESVVNAAERVASLQWKCQPIYDGDTVHLGPRLAIALAEFCEAQSLCWSSRLLAAKEELCRSRTAKLAH